MMVYLGVEQLCYAFDRADDMIERSELLTILYEEKK